MANSDALPEKKRTLPTEALLLHESDAPPATDRAAARDESSSLEHQTMSKATKRPRISDGESTNEEEEEEVSEAGSEHGEEEESVKSEDNNNQVIFYPEHAPPQSREHVPINTDDTTAVTDNVPITPERDDPETVVNKMKKLPENPTQLGLVGFCMETNQPPPKSGRIGTRSTTSSRPRKVWSTSNRYAKLMERRVRPKEARPRIMAGTDTGDCWYYYCPQCRHPFAFPKQNDLPPLDEQLNVSDKVPWGDTRFHQRIETIRRHMRIKHADTFPESDWPAGFAIVAGRDDDPYVEIESDSSAACPTGEVSGAGASAMDKVHVYQCFIKGCGESFRTRRCWDAPLNDKGEIMDDVRRWESKRLVRSVRAHMTSEHPDIDEEEWPIGFAKISKRPSMSEDHDCFRYECPLKGCCHEYGFPKTWNPPLDEHGRVSDAVPWKGETFAPARQSMQRHMRRRHVNVDESTWPAGFGHNMARRRASMASTGSNTVASTTVTDTNKAAKPARAFRNKVVARPIPEDLVGCYNYQCPIPGCKEIFGVPKHLYPPLDWYGNVTDYCPWPSQLDYVRQWVHFHIRKDHADDLSHYMKPSSSSDGAAETQSDERVDGPWGFMEGYPGHGQVEGHSDEDDGSNGDHPAEPKRCWCSYQQCWHRS